MGAARGEIKDRYEQLEHFSVTSLLSTTDIKLQLYFTSPPYKTEEKASGLCELLLGCDFTIKFHCVTCSPSLYSYLPPISLLEILNLLMREEAE